MLYRVRMYPRQGHAHDVRHGKFLVSDDGVTYTQVAGLDDDAHEGWNTVDLELPATPTPHRYIRYERPDDGRCSAAELQFIGVEVVNASAVGGREGMAAAAPDTDALCPITVAISGSNWQCSNYDPFGGLGGGFGGGLGGGFGGWRRRLSAPVFDACPSTTLGERVSYTAAATPVVVSVSPTFGGSHGGTVVTVSGSGFGTEGGELSVAVAGVACDVTTASDTQITCVTRPRGHTLLPSTVSVVRSGSTALVAPGVQFRYLDRWSDLSTWFASQYEPPVEGDSVVVPENQAVLLDVTPPRLFLLLIQVSRAYTCPGMPPPHALTMAIVAPSRALSCLIAATLSWTPATSLSRVGDWKSAPRRSRSLTKPSSHCTVIGGTASSCHTLAPKCWRS